MFFIEGIHLFNPSKDIWRANEFVSFPVAVPVIIHTQRNMFTVIDLKMKINLQYLCYLCLAGLAILGIVGICIMTIR